jgi:conjugal transfer pilus assembly protein TraW
MKGLSLSIALVALCVVLAMSLPVQAETLEARGQTYAPDRDAREEFKDVIRHKKETGELDRFWLDYRDKVVASVKHPAPLGVKSDYRPRAVFNPIRFTMPSDYVDAHGQVIVKQGTVVEPLKIQPLDTGLIFIDGRDQAQVDYAIARGLQTPLKIVLTAGSAFDLRVKYQHAAWRNQSGVPFYFDQRRIIIDTLRQLYGVDVASVPTLLTQEGTGLRVEYGMAPVMAQGAHSGAPGAQP